MVFIGVKTFLLVRTIPTSYCVALWFKHLGFSSLQQALLSSIKTHTGMLVKACQRLQHYFPPCIFSYAWKNNWKSWRNNDIFGGREENSCNDHSHCSRQNSLWDQHGHLHFMAICPGKSRRNKSWRTDLARSTQVYQPQISPSRDGYTYQSKAQSTGSQDKARYLCIT